jgi:hypothetical protein
MNQWFRGRIEACYVGAPITPATLQRPGAEHFKPHLYRALVREVEPIDPPAEVTAGATADAAAEPSQDAPRARAAERVDFRVARIDSTVIAGVRGPGSSYEGPAFDVRIAEASWSRGVRKDGKSYGIVKGHVVGYCELPPPAPPPELELRVVDAKAEAEAAPQKLVAELRQAAPAAAPEAKATRKNAAPDNACTAERAEFGSRADPGASTADEPEDAEEPVPEPASPRAKPEREDSFALPLFSIAVAIAITLWVSCGAAPGLLWSVFMLPTLLARKLFHGMLRDSNGIRGFGLALIVVQLFCSSTLLSSWWSADCKPLQLLPLLGIVVVIFPSGLLPSALPLCFNAAGLALVLGAWAGGGKCPGEAPVQKRALPAAPSVEHPGVPRTNPDGSWPKRPPG